MQYPGVLAVVIAVIILLIYIVFNYNNTQKIVSSIDNEHYNVVGTYEDSIKAADTLAIVNGKMIDFLRYLKIKYNINSYNSDIYGGNNRKINIVRRVVENYNPEVIFENPPGGSDTSYTIDKGEKLMMCLRSKKGLIHDPHTIMFVALHELSHIGNESWGHQADFWETFKFILGEALKAGVHIPTDYSKHPIRYCGLDINHNPFFDASINNI